MSVAFLGQLTANGHGGVDGIAQHTVHGQHDQTVVEQQHIAAFHVARQLLVVQTHTLQIAGFGARGIQHEWRTSFQPHLAFGKLADADLGALQVGHDGHFTACHGSGFTHGIGAVDMVLRAAVAEVQAHHVHARGNHLGQQMHIAGSRAERCHDLGGAADIHALQIHEVLFFLVGQARISASMASASTGTSRVISSQPVSVTTASSSMRMPMWWKCSGTPGAGRT